TENNIEISRMGGSLSSTALDGMASFGITMILLMILILAGGAISQEIATGSIKSLIIAPVKRWKIFLAKLMSLLTIGVTALLVHFVVTLVSYGIFFGFDTLSPYIFAVGGQAGAMSPILYLFAGQGVRFIEVIVFMSFALMLSVLTRNTAASVGISMAAYFGTSLASQILYFLPAAEWIKFMPFDHLNLTAKFFPFAVQDMYGMVNQNETTLLFSLIYIVVALICMLYTALDSFNRRDIK
ncbi:MAG: ABC transporter permease subunit, partial [Clostridiaceae bacterium]|nr:ABC transporter permease subunit [Clostridiaceae bacterium]